jgi:cytochrome c biogenesis protein CcmG/thiol:disulfide interchange protein DsbE
MSRRRLLIVLGALAVVAVMVVGLVQAGSKSEAPDQTSMSLDEQRAALADAPQPFAGLHDQASELLDGSPKTVSTKLEELRGHPVVINKWGSWCGPCRLEFPVFQRVAVKYGKEVAFLGLDGKDSADEARTFLKQRPVSYPSYRDPDEKVARSLQAGTYYPTTVFIDADGKRFVHQGPYNDDAKLEQDIKRYALGRSA